MNKEGLYILQEAEGVYIFGKIRVLQALCDTIQEGIAEGFADLQINVNNGKNDIIFVSLFGETETEEWELWNRAMTRNKKEAKNV